MSGLFACLLSGSCKSAPLTRTGAERDPSASLPNYQRVPECHELLAQPLTMSALPATTHAAALALLDRVRGAAQRSVEAGRRVCAHAWHDGREVRRCRRSQAGG